MEYSLHSLPLIREGISLILSQWHALQTTIKSKWGMNDSHHKLEEMTSNVLLYFSHAKVPLRIEDLENILDENMLLSFNTEIEDGSVEQVAEQLMVMHEEFLYGNYDLIEKLRISVPQQNVISQGRWAI